jgi:hypothetical protein
LPPLVLMIMELHAAQKPINHKSLPIPSPAVIGAREGGVREIPQIKLLETGKDVRKGAITPRTKLKATCRLPAAR